MSLVSRIKNLSKEKNLNLKLLEEQAGFGNGTIRRWDSSPPSADKLLKIAHLLNTSCEFLLTGIEQEYYHGGLESPVSFTYTYDASGNRTTRQFSAMASSLEAVPVDQEED